MTTAAFLYSVALQYQRANLSNLSEWATLLHLSLTAALSFLVSFGTGVLANQIPRYQKQFTVMLGLALTFGLVILAAVLVVLWLETRM